MNQDHIRYDLLVQEALKGVVRQVLTDAAEQGLPGEHHFYVSFRTVDPGVRISQRLREKYPEEMTIVLQHQFWDLSVTEHAFEVGLSFSGIPERLLVPFDALTGFFDPSVQFGLKFELSGAEPADNDQPEAEDEPVAAPPPPPAALPLPVRKEARDASRKAAEKATAEKQTKDAPDADKPKSTKAGKKADAPAEPAGDGAQVVRLDAFRKKP